MSWKSFTGFKPQSPVGDGYAKLSANVTWIRLFLGLSFGILLGYIESKQNTNLQGVTGIISGLLVIIFLPMVYINFSYPPTSETETSKNLYIQGLTNALALMLLIWITSFTIIHNEEELALTKATLHSIADVVAPNDNEAASGSMMEGIQTDNMDTEF